MFLTDYTEKMFSAAALRFSCGSLTQTPPNHRQEQKLLSFLRHPALLGAPVHNGLLLLCLCGLGCCRLDTECLVEIAESVVAKVTINKFLQPLAVTRELRREASFFQSN
jgi:hypothetical protein